MFKLFYIFSTPFYEFLRNGCYGRLFTYVHSTPLALFFKKKISYTEANLPDLIAACMSNNNQAQQAMLKIFMGYAKSICARYTSNHQEAEEILNEGFLKVFQHLEKYDTKQPFKAWLRTIFVNTAIDFYRKNQKYQLQSDLEEGLQVQDVDENIISRISAEEILQLIQQLPPGYRIVFTMYVIDGYNHREIGNILGIQEGTSKSNLRSARQKLQRMIKQAYPDLYQVYALKTSQLDEN